MRAQVTTAIALAGIGAWLVFALVTWAAGAPLGHDESQYAIAAKQLLAGDEQRWFYLSRGMNAVAAPGIWLGASERALRVAPLVLSLGFIVAMYIVGRRVVGAASAAWAIVVIAGSASIARLSTDLLSDLPAAACLLAAVAVIIDEVDREGARWRVVLAAPLLAAAFYVRYGSAVPIAVIAIASVVVGARTLAQRPMPVIVTALLFVALLVPHFVEARALTGSSLGILLESRAVPQQEHFADGLVTYVTSNPFRYYGLLTPFALVAGVLALRIRDRRRLLAWLIGVGSFVAMGLTTHGVARYIVFSVAILVVLGTDQVSAWLAKAPPQLRRGLSIMIVLALAAVWLRIVTKQLFAGDVRRNRMRGTLTAARLIQADAAGARCEVIGYHFTQLEWYSGCRAPLILDPGAAAAAHERRVPVYLVRDHALTWQPVFTDYPGSLQIVGVEPLVVEVARVDPSL